MTQLEIDKLILESIQEVLTESHTDLSHLQSSITNRTLIGEAWFKTISGLEGIVDETKEFNNLYSHQRHGPLPNTLEAMRILSEILKLCQQLKPYILGMDNIQKNDV